jgi:hypothetical protein
MLLKNIANCDIQLMVNGNSVIFKKGEIKEINNFPIGSHSSVLVEVTDKNEIPEIPKILTFEDELRNLKLIL